MFHVALGQKRHLINSSRKLRVVSHEVYKSCQQEAQVHGRVLPILQMVFSEMAVWFIEVPVSILAVPPLLLSMWLHYALVRQYTCSGHGPPIARR